MTLIILAPELVFQRSSRGWTLFYGSPGRPPCVESVAQYGDLESISIAHFRSLCHRARMTPFFVTAGIAVPFLVLLLWLIVALKRPLPFTRRKALLTPAELRFYLVLLKAIPAGITVFAKVRLMDIVDVPADAWRKYRAPASGMHADFVLAEAATTEPRAVIELDDRSHLRPDVRQRDAFKDAALAAAGVPVMRVAVAREYGSENLAAKIVEALAPVSDAR
jgi:Protein of unknown function (DUF2726)